VRVDDLCVLPSLISFLAPTTNFQGVTFDVSNRDTLREEAISIAIDDAITKAQTRAAQLDVEIQQVVGYEEASNEYQ